MEEVQEEEVVAQRTKVRYEETEFVKTINRIIKTSKTIKESDRVKKPKKIYKMARDTNKQHLREEQPRLKTRPKTTTETETIRIRKRHLN